MVRKRKCLADWRPPAGKEQHWQRFLFWVNRDMHLRGLSGRKVFPDALAALEYATHIVGQQGLALRIASSMSKNALKRRKGQFLFDVALVAGGEVEPTGNQLVFAWDVVRPTGAAVAYAQITGV